MAFLVGAPIAIFLLVGAYAFGQGDSLAALNRAARERRIQDAAYADGWNDCADAPDDPELDLSRIEDREDA